MGLLTLSHILTFVMMSLLTIGSSLLLLKLDSNNYFKTHRIKSIFITTFIWTSGLLLSGLYQVNKVNEMQQKTFQDLDYIAEILKNNSHSEITKESDDQSENYLNLINLEKKWTLKEGGFYTDIYTIRKNSLGQNILIVDSETDYNHDNVYEGDREQRTKIGEVYDKELPALEKVFSLHQPAFDDAIYTDKWGTFISGFYPIFDKKGNFDGVVGVDFDAEKLILEVLFTNFIFCFVVISFYISWLSFLYNQYSSNLYYKSLESSLAKNEENLKFQKQFIATISHELRTPLNGISGAVNLVEFEKLSKNDRENFEIVRHSSKVLSDIIGDVLDISKIESGNMSLDKTKVSLIEMLTSVRIMFTRQMIQKGIRFEIEIADEINDYLFFLDEVRLRQVVVNFISNAYKFTSFGSIKLSANIISKSEDSAILQFRIVDTGIGFSLEQERRLFKAFHQADNTITRKYGGTGLGLVICKNLITMMNGELFFKSVPGRGTEFVFTVLAGFIKTARQTPVSITNQIEKINLSDLKILVADDVVINQVVLSKTLSKLGYNCELAANGIEVLERHETLDFDLIFMDCQMPLMDGLKATEEIRDVEKNKNSLKPSTFIVAVTGNATDEDRRLCQLAGMNYFLPKPFMTADIEKVIQMAYDHKKSFESAQKAA